MSTWSYGGVQTSWAGVFQYLDKKGILTPYKKGNTDLRTNEAGKIIHDFLKSIKRKHNKRKQFYAYHSNAKIVQKHWVLFVGYVESLKNKQNEAA